MHAAVVSRTKRLLDIVGATAGLTLLAPALAAATAGVWITMGWPPIFCQERPGLKGRTFTIYKLRTMIAAKPGEVWFRTDNERLTPFGRFLRRTSIDELPELWNVLRGDMSLVGPRPLLVQYLTKYTAEESRRHCVKPGVTGWAQVNGRQNIPFSERLRLDVWYVDHWNIWLDLRILATTVIQVCSTQGVIPGQNVDDVDDIGLSADRERRRQA